MKPDTDGDFTLAAVAQFLWHHRWLVAGSTVVCALAAGFLAFTAKPYFRAEVLVTDVRDHGMGNLGSLANQLGGLASLAGVNLSQGGGTPGQETAAVLESHHLAEEFIKRNGLLPVLLKGSSRPPTLWLAVKEFTQNVLTIRKDQRKGVTTVTMQWTDPAVAAGWANAYVALANELIRARALDESNRNIAYLNGQLARTEAVDLRKVMYNLIENETKNLMVANGRTEYAFEVVDPAVPPEIKSGPQRLVNTFVGIMLGFGFGAALALLLERVGQLRREIRVGTQMHSIG